MIQNKVTKAFAIVVRMVEKEKELSGEYQGNQWAIQFAAEHVKLNSDELRRLTNLCNL
jgi:hypothetical protein